jgi:hypothetical protein
MLAYGHFQEQTLLDSISKQYESYNPTLVDP